MTSTAINVVDFAALAQQYQAAVDETVLRSFADSLAVTTESLKSLGIGRDRDAWTFPERNADGEIVGIAKRPDRGKKHMVTGSKRGLTLAWPLDGYAGSSPNDPILIVEGATCAAAGLDLGFTTIGRPSATGGADHLRALLNGQHVVVVGENDKAGRLGAEKVAQALAGDAASVRIIYPPSDDKDLRAWAQHADRAEIETAIRKADWVEPAPLAGLPTIIINNCQLRDVTADVIEAIARANDPPRVFVRRGSLARVRLDETGRPLLEPVGDNALRHRAARCAHFFRVNANSGDVTAVAPPLNVMQDVLAAEDLWPFPPLVGVTEVPVLRPDGSVLDRQGYDPDTHLLYIPAQGLEIPSIPDKPTQADVLSAVHLILDDLLVDFPFVVDGQDTASASRANAFSTLLTPIVRPAVEGPTPLHLIGAPSPGSGKGLLSGVIALIATGRPAALISAPESDAEMRKAITASLLSGATIISIDNVTGTLRWPSLSAAITAPVWDDRILGISKTASVPVRVTWLANGNNLRLGGDLPRRAVWTRLDPKHPRPWERTKFRHPELLVWVAANRGRIIAALLTLARAWHVAGRPAPGPILGSFEGWSKVMSGILEVAGVPGFLKNTQRMLHEADDDAPQWEAFLLAWLDHLGGDAYTTAQIADRLRDSLAGDLKAALPGHLGDALADSTKSFTRRLGRSLAAVQDRRFNEDGLRVERAPDDGHKHVATWRVVCDG